MTSVTSYQETQQGISVQFHFEDGTQLQLLPSGEYRNNQYELTGLEAAILSKDGTTQAAVFDRTDIGRGYVTRGPTQTQLAEYLATIIQTQEPQLCEIYKSQNFAVVAGIKNKKELLETIKIPAAKKLPVYLLEFADCLIASDKNNRT